jgi:hypothetical protein
MNTAANGERSEDTSRAEGWQEGSKGLCLQQSPSAAAGSHDREEGRQLIIHIENARDAKVFTLSGIQTAEEVREKIFALYPAMNHEKLELQCFSSRLGTKGRQPLFGPLPDIEEVWVTLYLRKH